MDKDKLIKAINAKGLSNSLISIWYNIGRALPFKAQRFPDGRVSEWYRSHFVEVHSVKPGGRGGHYGNAYGFYFGKEGRENAYWCSIDETQPKDVPCAGCGSWMLVDILGEPTTEPVKVYSLDDILESGKHKGETLKEVISKDWKWVEWAAVDSEHFYFDIDAVREERERTIKRLLPDDVLPFGKYKGQTIRQIYENDAKYLRWVMDNTSDYIIDLSELVNEEGESEIPQL